MSGGNANALKGALLLSVVLNVVLMCMYFSDGAETPSVHLCRWNYVLVDLVIVLAHLAELVWFYLPGVLLSLSFWLIGRYSSTIRRYASVSRIRAFITRVSDIFVNEFMCEKK